MKSCQDCPSRTTNRYPTKSKPSSTLSSEKTSWNGDKIGGNVLLAETASSRS
jgi:hypothetical protein